MDNVNFKIDYDAYEAQLPAKADAFAKLKAMRNNRNPIHWKPEIGDNLSGIVKCAAKVSGFNGNPQTVMHVIAENGETYSMFVNAYIDEFIRINGVKLGDLISITYQGKVKSKKGSMFNAYELHHLPASDLIEGGV